MQIVFDLISDLHLDHTDSFNWTGMATSSVCVVAGDVSRDLEVVRSTLEHLGQCYRAVFYIDGNNEHYYNSDSLNTSYSMLSEMIEPIENVVYLQNNCVIINGIAIVGTNGWWTWDLDPAIDQDQCKLWYRDKYQVNHNATDSIHDMAYHDAAYLMHSIKKLQTHPDVKKIVIVTHTVPDAELIDHDITLADTYEFNKMGNSLIQHVLNSDTENKIDTWCFGHYHNSVDTLVNGIRYVNNCRGRDGDDCWQPIYNPKRIVVNI